MGADGAPRVEVEGVLSAVREADVEIVLVGDEERVRRALTEAAPKGVPARVSMQTRARGDHHA